MYTGLVTPLSYRHTLTRNEGPGADFSRGSRGGFSTRVGPSPPAALRSGRQAPRTLLLELRLRGKGLLLILLVQQAVPSRRTRERERERKREGERERERESVCGKEKGAADLVSHISNGDIQSAMIPHQPHPSTL